MGKFETTRAHLSHYVFRNGILARLGITSDVIAATETERLNRIAAHILEIRFVSANHHAALRAWYGGHGHESGVRGMMTELLAAIANFRSVRPSSRFPSEEVIMSWLDQMESLFACLKSFPALSNADRERLANAFANGATRLLDLLSGLDADSKEFLMLFRPSTDVTVD